MFVSWTIGTSPDAELGNTMLDAAIETVAETTDRPVVHSDRGGHYRWPGWLLRIGEAMLIRSKRIKISLGSLSPIEYRVSLGLTA